MSVDREHPTLTQRSSYRYLFTVKHHGGGSVDDARWSPEVSSDEEFAIFDRADELQIEDEAGWLYGILRGESGQLRPVRTWGQQVAAFPFARPNEIWHGFPLWAVNHPEAPANRTSQKMRPERTVFDRLEAVEMITRQERRRLEKGDHA